MCIKQVVILINIVYWYYCFYFKAIHCVWDEWVEGVCSYTCGTGNQINTRTKLVTESNGGTCTGQDIEIVECNTNPCPGEQC